MTIRSVVESGFDLAPIMGSIRNAGPDRPHFGARSGMIRDKNGFVSVKVGSIPRQEWVRSGESGFDPAPRMGCSERLHYG
jgi:hypothetical protein